MSIVQTSDTNIEVLFENLPDWAVSMMHVVPFFYTEDGWDLDEVNSNLKFTYMWVKTDDVNYKLLIYIEGIMSHIGDEGLEYLPVYVDLHCYFLNKTVYQEIQHDRG